MREKWIDYSKALGMLFIIWGHINYLEGEPLTALSSYGKINVFFVISGILIWKKKECEKESLFFLKKKFKALLVPYFQYSFFAFMINIAFDFIVQKEYGIETVKKYLDTIVSLRGISTLWFLPILFFAELLAYFAMKIKWGGNVFLFVGPWIIWILIGKCHIYLIFQLCKIIIAAWFVICGIYLGEKQCEVKLIHQNGLGKKIIFGIILAGYFIVTYFNGNIDFNNMILGKNVALYFIGAFLSVLIVIISATMICQKKYFMLLDFLGENSLFIMATHTPFLILPVIEHLVLIFYKYDSICIGYYFICVLIMGILMIVEFLLLKSKIGMNNIINMLKEKMFYNDN